MTPWLLAVPKGRIFDNVSRLLADSGLPLKAADRSYRPAAPPGGPSVKILKPQNIPELVALGVHDAGFTGLDWIRETGAKVVELLDTGFDPVRIVAAVPAGMTDRALRRRRVLAASEYVRLTGAFLRKRRYRHLVLRTFGATEVFPPEDADLIVDNCATGQTLRQNNLRILDVLLESSTRFIASPKAMKDPAKRRALLELAEVMKAVLEGRSRVLLEMNVEKGKLERLVKALPCMKSPTIQPLHGGDGYAVKVAVKRTEVRALLPRIRALGAADILEYELRKVLA